MAIKLAISFGLVYIPVNLTVAVKNNDIGFNMIDKHTLSRIKYKKTCLDCDEKEVKNTDIVRGYQYEKDKYVIFTDADFEKLKTEKDKTITIQQFVNLNEVDPIYLDKSYYVSPNGADGAFNLLLQAMQSLNKAGIAKAVIGNKETLILLRTNEGKMLLNTMFFAEEVLAAPTIKPTTINKKELDLAKTLINQMSDKFNIQNFTDEYTQRVKAAIQRKIDGGQIVAPKQTKAPAKVINIMEALKKSLNAKVSTKKVSTKTSKISTISKKLSTNLNKVSTKNKISTKKPQKKLKIAK